MFYTDNPHIIRLQTVVQMLTFLVDAKAAGVTEDELSTIVATVAADPEAGDLIVGTGGARKLRIGGKGRGKSGGYRVITYFAAVDVHVFLLALVSKGQRADISQADHNTLRVILGTLVDGYREGVTAKVRAMSPGKE